MKIQRNKQQNHEKSKGISGLHWIKSKGISALYRIKSKGIKMSGSPDLDPDSRIHCRYGSDMPLCLISSP